MNYLFAFVITTLLCFANCCDIVHAAHVTHAVHSSSRSTSTIAPSSCCVTTPDCCYFTQLEPVKIFIKQMVNKYHFDECELYRLFSTVKRRPKIIQSTKSPLEQKPWYTYRLLYVTNERIKQGVLFWNTYQDTLNKAEKLFGVPAAIIIATIGVESRYGKNKGEYPVIDALVNLGFDEESRRAPYFRKELEEFLLLAREEHMNPLNILGSYAGAIGQPQFMPSSFRRYAINFSKQKKIDLSNNPLDVIASIANYYAKNGWIENAAITRPLTLSGSEYQFRLAGMGGQLTLSELIENKQITEQCYENTKGSLIALRGNYGNEYWLGYHNFEVIKRYNHSNLYAMAVYQLSYYITSLREKMKHVS